VVVPALTPVSTPVYALIAAILPEAVDHSPPVDSFDKEELLPTQTTRLPAISLRPELIVMILVATAVPQALVTA
jgi:hypothetical protein